MQGFHGSIGATSTGRETITLKGGCGFLVGTTGVIKCQRCIRIGVANNPINSVIKRHFLKTELMYQVCIGSDAGVGSPS